MFENKEKIILVMEYADGGEMYDHISCRGRLTENEARSLFRQIVSALHHLHEVIISLLYTALLLTHYCPGTQQCLVTELAVCASQLRADITQTSSTPR